MNTGSWRTHSLLLHHRVDAQPTEQCVHTERLTSMLPPFSARPRLADHAERQLRGERARAAAIRTFQERAAVDRFASIPERLRDRRLEER